MERQPKTFELKYLQDDDDYSLQTHPLKGLRTAKNNQEIIGAHSVGNFTSLRDDLHRNDHIEDKEKLNEKLCVNIAKEPLFQQEAKQEICNPHEEQTIFGTDKVEIIERDIIPGIMSIDCEEEETEKPKKSKKKSIFSELMKKKKQAEGSLQPLNAAEEKISFPKSEKCFVNNQIKQVSKVESKLDFKVEQKAPKAQPVKNNSKDWWSHETIKEEYKSDLADISSQNDQKINQMSQEEIKSAVAEIYKTLPPHLIERFKNIGRMMNKKEPIKIEFDVENNEEIKESKSDFKPFPPTIQDVKIENTLKLVTENDLQDKEIFIRKGEFKLGERENLEGQSLLISDVLKINEDTDLEEKYFSSNDLVFLLHSSYLPHRILALSIVENFVNKNSNQTYLIQSLLIEKDILDAGFTILSNLSGVTPLFQLKLFGLLELLLQLIYPVIIDEFDLIQTTSADVNTQSKIWIENQIGDNIQSIKDLHDQLITKYEIIETCVSFIATQYGQSKKFTSELHASNPESDLTNIFVKILERLLLFSSEGVEKIISNNFFIAFCRALFFRKETQLLIILSKASREAASMICTVSDSLETIKENIAVLPSQIIKALSCYQTEQDNVKQQLLKSLILVHNLKVNGKSKFLFKADTYFPEILEILKLILCVLKNDSIDLPKDTSCQTKICKDPGILKIIIQTLSIIKYDIYQNCKEWIEEKTKKSYGQINSLLDNIFDSLMNDSDYQEQLVTCNVLMYHVFVLSQIQSDKFNSAKTLAFAKKILAGSIDRDSKKALLYIIRKSMCKDVESLKCVYELYSTYYKDCSSLTINDKYYWYPIKVVLMNFLHNSETLQKNCEGFNECVVCLDLMQFLLPRDEYALMNIISILFAPNETLKVFFLGYCINNDVATNVSKPFYDIVEPANYLGYKKIHKNPYIPIETDWFIKPVIFSKKAKLEGDTSKVHQLHSLSYLFTEIFKELEHAYFLQEDDVKKRIYGDLSKYQIFHLGLSYVCHAYLQNKQVLVTKKIIESLKIIAQCITNQDAQIHIQDTKISHDSVKENIELAISFLNTFYQENCSEYVIKAIMHFTKKEFKMNEFIQYHLQDVWHCIEDEFKQFDSN